MTKQNQATTDEANENFGTLLEQLVVQARVQGVDEATIERELFDKANEVAAGRWD